MKRVVGDLHIDLAKRRVEMRKREVKLSSAQWCLLEALAWCPGTLVTRAMLLAVLHPDKRYKPSRQSVDVVASQVRRKLVAASGGTNYIHAVRCEGGYILREQVV